MTIDIGSEAPCGVSADDASDHIIATTKEGRFQSPNTERGKLYVDKRGDICLSGEWSTRV
jgi:hypothetical protein